VLSSKKFKDLMFSGEGPGTKSKKEPIFLMLML
jgi:hypothetical protein